MSWIKTHSGRRIDFLEPDVEQIHVMDISVSLGRIHRFGGHSPLKVGQHVIEVMNLMLRKAEEDQLTFSKIELSEIALVGLLHDFPEYVIGDIPTPLKRLLSPQIAEIESRLLDAMLVKWNLADAYTKWNGLLHWADRNAVQQEAHRFGLDGSFIEESEAGFTDTKTDFEWVPGDIEITLSNLVYETRDVMEGVLRAFVRHMVLSGRTQLLSPHYRAVVAQHTPSWKHVQDYIKEDAYRSIMHVTSPIFDKSVFTDHAGYN